MSLTTQTTGALAMVPRDMREAMDLAKVMASAGFLAKELQTVGGAMFVIEQASRWNMSPFAVAMETSFIQGKPMFSGKIVAAAVVSSGAILGRLQYAYDGQGDNRTITVSGTARGETAPRTVTVRLGDAKTANKVWQTQPDQQLAYHGARVWARRHTPEVMLGVYSEEEMDMPAQPPMPRASGPTIDSVATPAAAPEPVLELTMVDCAMVERIASGGARWLAWCLAAVKKISTVEALVAWRTAMAPHMEAAISAGGSEAVDELNEAVQAKMDGFAADLETAA